MSNHPSQKHCAFVLFGGATSSIDSGYIEAIRHRGLVPLIVDLPSSRRGGPPPLVNSAVDMREIGDAQTTNPIDIPRILTVCKEWQARYEIAGALNTIEEYLYAASIACEFLQVPHPGMLANEVCRNKSLQRELLREWSPDSQLLRGGKLSCSVEQFPVVIKALDNHGGEGIRTCLDEIELSCALDSLEASQEVLLEEYIEGRDFSVESLVANGQVIYQGVTEEVHGLFDGCHLEMGYYLPAIGITRAVQDRAKEISRQILRCLNFDTGMSHIEYRLDDADRIFLIELASRPPGDGLMAMYRLSSGSAIESALVDMALGAAPELNPPVRSVAQRYLVHEPGCLGRVEVIGGDVSPTYYGEHESRKLTGSLSPDAAARICEVLVEVPRGTQLVPIRNARHRAVSVIVDGPTEEATRALIEEAVSSVRIHVNDRSTRIHRTPWREVKDRANARKPRLELQDRRWPPVPVYSNSHPEMDEFLALDGVGQARELESRRKDPERHAQWLHEFLSLVSAYLFGYEDSPTHLALDDELETALLSAKIRAERVLLDHWLEVEEAPKLTRQEEVAEYLETLAMDNPSERHELFEYLGREAGAESMRVFLLNDAMRNEIVDDEVAMLVVGHQGRMKAAMASNLWDEVGRGRLDRFHTYWLRRLLDRMGSWDTLHAYRSNDRPWCASITTNVFNALLTRPGLRSCKYGWFLINESWVAPHFEHILRGMDRLGIEHDDIRIYFKAHVAIDPRHSSELLDAIRKQVPRLCETECQQLATGAQMAIAANCAQHDRMLPYLKTFDTV